jgi:hypothetical protein
MSLFFSSDIHSLVARINQTKVDETPMPDPYTRAVRLIAITTGILFSIRFKTVWISENKKFNRFVVFNYLLGLGLYVGILVGTKTSSFDVFKALVGV